MKNEVYSAVIEGDVLAGATWTGTWNLLNTNRDCLLKSVTFDIMLSNQNVPPQKIPLETNQIITISLSLFAVTSPISRAYLNVALPLGAVINNGTQLRFFSPCHAEFDSFFISNDFAYTLQLANFDLINNIHFAATVITEIEDIIRP